MPPLIELLPEQPELATPLFKEEEHSYTEFREWYVREVCADLQRLQEARHKSEEESRHRLLG